MKKFFIKVWSLIVNSLLVTMAFLFLVIWGNVLTVAAFIIAVCRNESWHSLKLRLIMIWTKIVEALMEGITMLQEYDKEHYGI